MNPGKRNNIIWSVLVIVGIIVGIFIGRGTAPKATSTKTASASDKTVKVGVMAGSAEDDAIWKAVGKTAKDKYGITLKITHFTDYTQPNKALVNGDVDINAFQHYAFLNAWNKSNKDAAVSIGDTVITPIHLYSTKYKSVDQIPADSEITVPNDASNESRALYVLEAAGLIKLDVSGDALATVKNITSSPKNIKVKEVDAAQTARTLDSVAAAVVNQNFAVTAKITASASIFKEPFNKNSAQWVNLIATAKENKDNKVLKDVVKAYQSSATKDAIKEAYPDDSELAAWDLDFSK